MSEALLRCRDLVVGYREPLLPPIDLTIGRGEFWSVVGRNGSGKTTWFRTVLGLAAPISGTVELGPGVRCSYVPQRSAFDALYSVTARDVVGMGAERHGSFFRLRAPDTRDALAAVDAGALADRPFRSLSEGQKQRVLLARLVASGAGLAFLDEPTAAMDIVAEQEALTLLDGIRHRFGTAVVVVSHSLAVFRRHADHVLFVDRAAPVVMHGTPGELEAHPVFRARYGMHHA